MRCQYTRIMAKIIRSQRASRTRVQTARKKMAKAKTKSSPKRLVKQTKSSKSRPSKRKSSRPSRSWTPAEVREAFERFRKANPDPKGELEHLNAFTLVVAV